MNKTLTGAAIGAALVLGLAGCSSADNQGQPRAHTQATKPSQTSSKASTEPSKPTPPADGSLTAKKSLKDSWTFATSTGCKVTFQVVPWGSDTYTTKLANYFDTYDTGFNPPDVVKAVIDYTHPTPTADNQYGCSISSNLQLITPSGKPQTGENSSGDSPVTVELNKIMDKANTNVYNQGVDLIDVAMDKYEGADWHTKGLDYSFFNHLKPFSTVVVQPLGMGGETISSVVQSTANLLTSDSIGKPMAQTDKVNGNTYSLVKTTNKNGYLGLEVEVCNFGDKPLKVKPSTFWFPYGETGAGQPANSGQQFGTPLKTTSIGHYECSTGWLSLNVAEAGSAPSNMLVGANGAASFAIV